MTHIVLYLLAFLVAFLLLVTVHEFGHFWVARRLGFKVLRFSVGFGKPLWKYVHPEGHEYWLCPILLGGYVKMADEREGPVAAADLPRSFTRRPHWQRLLVLLAGPGFNILFAILVLTGLRFAEGITQVRPVLGAIDPQSIAGQAGLKAGDEILAVNSRAAGGQGDVELDLLDAISAGRPIRITVREPGGTAGALRTVQLRGLSASERLRLTEPASMDSGLGLAFYQPPAPAVISQVVANQPAARAGLEVGDRIVAVDGQPVNSLPDVQKLVRMHAGQQITVRYRRGAHTAEVQLTPILELVDGQRVGMIGVDLLQPTMPPSMLRHIDLSLPAAFVRANVEAWDVTALQGRMVWRMLIDKVSIKNLGGPLTIAEYAGDAASEGLPSFLSFLVLLSLVLGFMNLLPIPILDGGQIVFQGIEWLKGSPLSERFQLVSQQLGIALLFLLMGVALFNDLSQFG
ncbi:MAG TPA: RIP metalloprotease RseP [Steroidobacteraceae bacterium]|nr:RIP metalloprotease RseP [Steroidobacteraceae bacterium]